MRFFQLLVTVALLGLFVSPTSGREWNDANNYERSVEATLVRIDGDNLLLQKPDGSRVTVAIWNLHGGDCGYVEDLLAAGWKNGMPAPEDVGFSTCFPRVSGVQPQFIAIGGGDEMGFAVDKKVGIYRLGRCIGHVKFVYVYENSSTAQILDSTTQIRNGDRVGDIAHCAINTGTRWKPPLPKH
ncbi:MAG: hypothetical protein K8T91_28465 [Planctomycetes bacterium]|nr:hypothetical protein [Planctomycetota bacterium]